ncbi:type II secretion system F family protein [Candidatus Woesearchaeota archaeon]|nr:type II secretion system F family protein [Candidatus Woesearchaeota archaeon]
MSVILLTVDYFLFWGERWFYPGIVIAISIGWLQFWMDYTKEIKRQKEIELKFLEFVRNLVENVRSGIPVPKAISQVSTKDYGALNPYIKKLAYQMEWGVPVPEAFVTFAKDTRNDIIKRAVTIIIEAEKSGGDIGDVLVSVAGSLIDIKKMKQERRASVYSQIVQGYIVYFVFIAIMLALQLWLFPQLTDIFQKGQSKADCCIA